MHRSFHPLPGSSGSQTANHGFGRTTETPAQSARRDEVCMAASSRHVAGFRSAYQSRRCPVAFGLRRDGGEAAGRGCLLVEVVHAEERAVRPMSSAPTARSMAWCRDSAAFGTRAFGDLSQWPKRKPTSFGANLGFRWLMRMVRRARGALCWRRWGARQFFLAGKVALGLL